MSEGYTGLMAPPGGPRLRPSDEEEARRQRELGFYGLLTSLAEPFSMLPGPAGDVAQAAANVGREGWGQGLMRTASELLLPKVLRRGPTKMSVVKRATVSEENMLAGLKGKELQSAMEELGLFRGLDTRPIRELASQGAKLTPKALKELARYRMAEGELGDLWDFPEFFERTPPARGVETKLVQVPGGKGVPAIRGHLDIGPEGARVSGGRVFLASSKPPEDLQGLLGGLAHEGTHINQIADRRTYGSSPAWIRENIEFNHGDMLPSDPTERSKILERLGKILYGLNLGEREAYAAQRRRLLAPGAEKVRPFNEDVLKVGQEGGDMLPITADRIIRTPPYKTVDAWPSYVPLFREYLAKILAEKGLNP